MKTYENWVWVELLAFDIHSPDLGVSLYIETLGFTPQAVSLLVSSPDFVLQHEGLETDAELPPDICARNGQPGNEQRRRQVWTRHGLRRLILTLQGAGCAVYFSIFTDYLRDEFHHEWLHDHPDGKIVLTTLGRAGALWPLARLEDGTLLQDYFVPQLVRVCQDYGFDGWHGPDGFGPGAAALIEADCSDDMIRQFTEWGAAGLPEIVTAPSEDQPERLQARVDWVWRHRRLEWIEFYCDRWAEFWSLAIAALHGIGCKAVINSAWTRDPFEARYRYGIDYRKIVEAGIDAIVVETVAGSIMLGSSNRDYHYDYLSALLLTRAHVPDAQLIYLLPIKDVNENWDVLRHAPTMLEREIYSLANIFHVTGQGQLTRSADGFMACLADGISREEWQWLEDRRQLAYDTLPTRALGPTLVWSDAAFEQHLKEFPVQRDWSVHRLVYRLMQHGAPIQASVDISSIDKAAGPLLVALPHLLPAGERQRLLDCGRPLVVIGPALGEWPDTVYEWTDSVTDRPMQCRLYGVEELPEPKTVLTCDGTEYGALPSDLLDICDPPGFREELVFRPATESFLKLCAELAHTVGEACRIETSRDAPDPGIMLVEKSPGVYRLAVKSSEHYYRKTRVDLGRPIRAVNAQTHFPIADIEFENTTLNLTIPPRGIVVVDVTVRE